jgi:hypothetical protein
MQKERSDKYQTPRRKDFKERRKMTIEHQATLIFLGGIRDVQE